MIHTTIGLYPNGEFKVNGVTTNNLPIHIEYNKRFRFGRALFVDGVCIYKGCVSDKLIDKHTILFNSESKYILDVDTQPYH